MSTNTNSSTETHSIEATDDLVKSVIVDQTDNIEKGWREGVQNMVDSEATDGYLEYTTDYTYMSDNGQGIELTEDAGLKLLTHMGESSKDADDHSSIGRFGIGKGQIMAKGLTAWISGDQVLFFDIKEWGLEAKQVSAAEAPGFIVDHSVEMFELLNDKIGLSGCEGLAVIVDHYEDEVPESSSYKWDRYEENVKERFQYLNAVNDTNLYLNDELISDGEWDSVDENLSSLVDTVKTEDSGEILYALEHGVGDLTVYSGGIKVTNIDSRGLQGSIITSNNLQLNFARNEIKSGCPLFSKIQDDLVEYRKEIFEDVDDYENGARKFLADRMFNQDELDDHADEEVFETASENMVSWNDLKSMDEVGMAEKGNQAADKLEEIGHIVLNKYDDAVSKFQAVRDDLEEAPDEYDASDKAEDQGIFTEHKELEEDGLTPTQKKQLGIARYISNMINDEFEVRFGESDVANAWTDGRNYITITDSAASGSSYAEWVPSLWKTVVHEHAHRFSSKDNPSHGRSFDNRFRDLIDESTSILSHTQALIDKRGLSRVAADGHMIYQRDVDQENTTSF